MKRTTLLFLLLLPVAMMAQGLASSSEAAFSANVFPNPATDHVAIEISGSPFGKECTIRVFNLTGKLVMEESTASAKYDLWVDKLPSGIYFVKIGMDGKQVVEKVTIDRP